MKRLGLVVLAVALCMIATRPAMAQGTLRYGINAGLLMPVSDYNTLDKMGWIAGAGATYWLPGNVGIRGDVSYSTTSHKGTGGGSTKITGGLASVGDALSTAVGHGGLVIPRG